VGVAETLVNLSSLSVPGLSIGLIVVIEFGPLPPSSQLLDLVADLLAFRAKTRYGSW
jgi:hypothetical protein